MDKLLKSAELARIGLVLNSTSAVIDCISAVVDEGYEHTGKDHTLTNRQRLEISLGQLRLEILQLCVSGDVIAEAMHTATIKAATELGVMPVDECRRPQLSLVKGGRDK